MGHVRQKKSTSSSTSTPPEPLAIEFVNLKEQPRENRYPEQLNAEELISQINCSRNLNSNCNNNNGNAAIVAHHNNSHNLQNNNNSNDVRNSNDTNNNSHAVNSSSNHQQHQRRESVEVDDVEKGSEDLQRNYRQKSLFRRLYSFIRNLYMGAKFNVGKDGKLIFCNYLFLFGDAKTFKK
jgi:hypothetical protein